MQVAACILTLLLYFLLLVVQHELGQLLYPIFIHCCLKLVGAQAASEASQLISRYSRRFATLGAQPSKIRMQVRIALVPCALSRHKSIAN